MFSGRDNFIFHSGFIPIFAPSWINPVWLCCGFSGVSPGSETPIAAGEKGEEVIPLLLLWNRGCRSRNASRRGSDLKPCWARSSGASDTSETPQGSRSAQLPGFPEFLGTPGSPAGVSVPPEPVSSPSQPGLGGEGFGVRAAETLSDDKGIFRLVLLGQGGLCLQNSAPKNFFCCFSLHER